MLLDLSTVPVIETERLRLCLPRWDHFEAFADMHADEETARFIGGARDRGLSFRTMAMIIGHWVLRGYGLFTVEERESGAFVGRVGLLYPEDWPALELAWALARPYWGRGYAFEAARAVLRSEVPKIAPERLISFVHTDNERSRRLALRLGAIPGEPMMLHDQPVTIFEHPLGH